MRFRFRSNFAFLIFLFLGLYLFNKGASIVSLPEIFQEINNVVLIVSGILLILGGLRFIKLRKKRKYH